MSDFEQVENPAAAVKVEEGAADPVADFLAREQDQLAELDDNFGAVNLGSNDNVLPADDQFGSDHIYGNVTAAEYDGMPTVEGAGSVAQESDVSDQYSALKSVDRMRQEPEKIRLWREEQAERLAKKDAESEKKKAEWREAARQELEDWYRHRDEQVDKSKKLNRDSEDAFVTERDEKKPGGEWERICRLCDFNPKSSTRASKDVSRMRSILLQLKQTPIVGRQ
jgi:clathrin light chain A